MLYIIYTYILHNNIIYIPILPFSYTKASQLCTRPAPCFFLLIYLRDFSVTAHRDDPPSMGGYSHICLLIPCCWTWNRVHPLFQGTE